jgi:hypothetical protein
MFGRTRITLGGWLLLVFLLLGYCAVALLSSTFLLWHGVPTQGVIFNVQTFGCGSRSGSGSKKLFTVQFTDRSGQAHSSTIDQCTYSNFNASPGDTVTIVYLPNDPITIAPPGELLANAQFELIGTILSGLITLILLPLWIRKRMLKVSLKRRVEPTKADRWRAGVRPFIHSNGAHQD